MCTYLNRAVSAHICSIASDGFERLSECICLMFLCSAVLRLMSAVTASLYECAGVYLALSGKVVRKQE